MKIKKILVLLLFMVAIVGIMAPITAVDSAHSNKLKVKWDANGGKIGTKKTVITYVKKGSKINKHLKTLKMNGYTFEGWVRQA